MKKNMISKVASAALVAGSMALVGCGNGDGNSTSAQASTSTTASGTASDGYIKDAKVCLDMNLNNQCDNEEPFTVTDVNGSYTLTVSAQQKKDANAHAPLLVSGGTDIDTKKPLTGTFKVPFDGSKANVTAQITPLTTLVAAMVEKNVSVTTAYKQVAKALGLTEAEVKADPVKLAKENNNTKVIEAAMTVHRIITTMADSAGVNNSDIYSSLVTSISDVAKSNETNTSIVTIVTKAADTNSTLPQKAKEAAKVADVIATTVSKAIKTNKGNIKDAASASSTAVNAIQVKVQDAIENNTTINQEFVTNVEANASAILNYANDNLVKIAVKNILDSYDVTISDADIAAIADNFTSSSDVSVENIITSSDINSTIKSDLKTAYTAQQIKLYIEKNNQTVTAAEVAKIAAISGIDYKSLKTMSLADFSKKIYDTGDTNLMSLSLKLSPPANIASMSDIQKAKALFTSVRTQVNDADTFTQNESTKINTALNNLTDTVEFTTNIANTLNDMVSQAIDSNQTSVSRLVANDDRNITVTKTNPSGNVVWGYSVKDINVTNPWNGSLTYTDIGNPDDFDPSNFSTLTAELAGTLPIDYYSKKIAEGKTNSQTVDANVKITKINNGATFHLDASIVNNGDSVKITDANAVVIYDTNATTKEPLPKYVELKNLYINGTVGAYTLDGKLDVKSYAINKIGAEKGFDPETTYYSFGIAADCTKSDGTGGNGYNHGGIQNPSSVTYNGIPVSQYNPINSFLWFNLTSKPVDVTESSKYLNLTCKSDETLKIRSFYYDEWTDDDLENSGHFPSEITFDGKLTNNVASTYLDAKIDAKWTNIVDANLSDDNYEPNLDVTVNGTLAMPDSAVMNVGLVYKNIGKARNAKVIYVNGDVSITANTAFSDDNGTKVINLSSTSGIKSTIILNGDNTVDYSKSTVTNTNGASVGTVVDRAGAPAVKYADGTFETLF